MRSRRISASPTRWPRSPPGSARSGRPTLRPARSCRPACWWAVRSAAGWPGPLASRSAPSASTPWSSGSATWSSSAPSAPSCAPSSRWSPSAARSLTRALGLPVGAEREHALVERVGDVVFLCPLRTELRTLQSLVAFRSSVPDEVADAFVSAGDVERAEQTLERWESERPGSRSHIQQAAWHVPLPWFTLFEDGERRVGAPASGQVARLTYRTTMAKARRRVSRAVSILQELMGDAEMVVAVEELRAWLHSFDPDSLVQLDYGGLTRAIPFEDLV